MKTREEVARFIESQFHWPTEYACKLNKGGAFHYGKQEARELMDFIYGGGPTNETDKVHGKNLPKKG